MKSVYERSSINGEGSATPVNSPTEASAKAFKFVTSGASSAIH
jgi:hypothetical protein